ncbi:hypothetical protein CAPTEDRAFT_194349 [Capitella teleta]|nr:hypothetical protein CAPTEDRAFT_194349 [Capitella teleta]|eukprot:ELU17531.1 hypothetical protein CAPTEDRAFT_194349 [Capitella teleta]
MVQNYKQWEPITLECKDCLLRMLSIDPAHRLAASEILSHPWITGESLDPANGPRNVLEMMRAWGYQLEDDDTASVSPSESSAIKIQPSINVEEYSSQEGSSGPPSRNGSASSSTAKFSNGSTPQPPRSLSRQRTNSSDLLLPNSNNRIKEHPIHKCHVVSFNYMAMKAKLPL